MLQPEFQEAAAVLKKLRQNGHEAYIVGGAVRNFILGKKVEDIDIATSALPEQVRALFHQTIPVGIKHGTVIVRHCHHSFEVTTFREEADYKDFRRPSSVSFVSSIHTDLGRRDFTMNAIAMSLEGEMIDPYLGKEDIENGVIRCVGKAEERFREDPLRMMRAIRFKSQLSFHIEEKTCQSLQRLADFIQHISVERVTVEFEKLLLGDAVRSSLSVLLDSGLFAWLPGMKDKKGELERLVHFKLHALHSIEERWALVCFVFGLDHPLSWLRQWKLSNRRMTEITGILQLLGDVLHSDWTCLRVYYYGLDTSLSAERILSLLSDEQRKPRLRELGEMYNKLPIKSRTELGINGKDLLSWYRQSPGPWVSADLKTVEEAVVTGVIHNEKGAIRAWLKEYHHTSDPPF